MAVSRYLIEYLHNNNYVVVYEWKDNTILKRIFCVVSLLLSILHHDTHDVKRIF